MVHSILRHESNSHTCAMRDPSRRTAGVRIRVTLLSMKLSSENFRMYTFVCDLKAVNVPNYIMKKRDYDKIFKGSEIFPRNSASRAFTKTVEGRARVVPHTIAWDLSRAIKSPRLLTRNRAQRRLTRFIAVRLQVLVSSVEGNARIRGTNFDHVRCTIHCGNMCLRATSEICEHESFDDASKIRWRFRVDPVLYFT